MPCCYYTDGQGVGSCALNFYIRGRTTNPCHMKAEEKTPEWKECSYNHPIVKKAIQEAVAVRLEAKVSPVSS